MPTIVDSVNVVNSLESAPDRLRAEIGRYYTTEPTGPFSSNFAFFRSGVKTDFIHEEPGNNQQLIPTKKARIFISGRDEQFRDQIQWNEYVKKTIITNRNNLDHQFYLEVPEIESSFVKNYHNPPYEDSTKGYPSNQLLNYNLITYPHKDNRKVLKRVGDLRSVYDDESYSVVQRSDLNELMREFPNRLTNYTGSIEEISLKQRNIFDLQRPREIPNLGVVLSTQPLFPPEDFPYYYSKTLPEVQGTPLPVGFNDILGAFNKKKNLYAMIKRDLSFSIRDFNIGEDQIQGKIYNLINLLTSTNVIDLQEETNELFLVPEQELNFDSRTQRFANQISTIRFLSHMRQFMSLNARKVEEIFDAQPSKTFFLGYKIEKYLENAAQSPIQTYYTNDSVFYDTQLKYGSKYIYKTKILFGILGSSYKYTNLFISQNETEMMSEAGVNAESFPSGFQDIANEKFRAYVDVEATPSFQLLEYEVDVSTASFVDSPTSSPQVDFYNNPKKGSVEFFLSPMMNSIGSFTPPQLDIERPITFDVLTQQDERVQTLLSTITDKDHSSHYFTGVYEVYRLETRPNNESDFANALLAVVDDKTTLAYPPSVQLPEVDIDNMNGYFEDFLIPNKKYYYAFRTLTYHGTPSSLTAPFEVELVRDSDEYKVMVKECKYFTTQKTNAKLNAKRLIHLTPNMERLFFSEAEKTPAGQVNYKLDDGNMLNKNHPTKIKIRLTSKHTGKKMDINLNIVLKEDNNSFT